MRPRREASRAAQNEESEAFRVKGVEKLKDRSYMMDWNDGAMRINKFLSAMGYCSRREADRLIEEGKVKVDGVRAELGTLVEPGMKVTVKEELVGTLEDASGQKTVLLAVNKPAGIVCTTTDNDRAPNIVDMVDYPTRVYPVGRLDKDSEGLMLMTNRGDLVNEILRASNVHEKEYLVRVDKALTEGFVDKMRRGVHLDELQVTTRPCKVIVKDKTSFIIVLTQGLNRQIRRMCEALGFHVISLKRIRIMNIRLGNLKPGTWRNVTAEELRELENSLKKSESSRAGRTGSAGSSTGTGSAGSRGAGSSAGRTGGTGSRSTGSSSTAKAGAKKTGAGKPVSAADQRRTENYKTRQKEYFRAKSEAAGKAAGGSKTGGKTGGRAAGKSGAGASGVKRSGAGGGRPAARGRKADHGTGKRG